MGDHFVLLVDRLLTESTLEAAIRSGNLLKQEAQITINDSVDSGICSSPGKMVECKICLDEDVDSRMEAPCSCKGSLKFAHRKCVQKWCNEKGDTTCEICHEQFKHGYIAPPPAFQYPIDLRRNWRILERNVDNHRIITMVSRDSTFLDPDDVSTSPRCTIIFRAIATIFMILLILGHTFVIAESYTFAVFMMLTLGITGIFLSLCIILKTLSSFIAQRNHLQANNNVYESGSREEGDSTQQHVIAIQ